MADTFWLLLRGSDAVGHACRRRKAPASRVVLLHGWLQTSASWMKTATALRDEFGHDVLLLDFYGHGHSAVPPSSAQSLRYSMSPEGWMAQLCERLAAIGWDHGQQLVLAGASLGAAVAMQYTCAHPSRVARLNLIAPAGLPEPFWHGSHTVWIIPRAVCGFVDELPHRAQSLVRAVTDLFQVTRTSPEYGVDIAKVLRLIEGDAEGKRGHGLHLTVYAAGWDVVHSPHRAFWESAAKPSGGRVRYRYLPRATHWGVCARLYELGLHKDEEMWHGTCQNGIKTEGGVRARL